MSQHVLRRTFALVLPLLGLVLSTCGVVRTSSAQERLDLKFVTSQAFSAIIAHPQKVLSMPEMEMLPVEILSAAGKRDLGIDPVDIEQVMVFIEPPQGPGPPSIGVVARLSKPFDPDSVLAQVLAESEEKTSGDKTYRRAAHPMLPSVHFPNRRTIVAAPEEMLLRMIGGDHEESPLRKLLASADPVDHLRRGFRRCSTRDGKRRYRFFTSCSRAIRRVS